MSLIDTKFVMTIYALAGSAYTMQSATNLNPPVSWSRVLTGNATSFSQVFTLPTTSTQCFYRLMIP
jgi:hypothetical protein